MNIWSYEISTRHPEALVKSSVSLWMNPPTPEQMIEHYSEQTGCEHLVQAIRDAAPGEWPSFIDGSPGTGGGRTLGRHGYIHAIHRQVLDVRPVGLNARGHRR